MNDLITRKKQILHERMLLTTLDALRAMARMQTRPVPFLTTVGAATAVVGQVRYELPRTGDLSTRYDPVLIAKNYLEAGANAISMFTDGVPEYDSSVDMTLVHEALNFVDAPLISQDYMIHEYSVLAARAAGASVVVLTSGIVSSDVLRQLTSAVHRSRMTAVVDVFNEAQLTEALAWSPQVIGLSGRNPLGSDVDLAHVAALRAKIPMDQHVMITNPLHELDDLEWAARIGVSAVTLSDRLLLGGMEGDLAAILNPS